MKHITLTIILFVSLFTNAQDTIVESKNETNKTMTLTLDKSLIDERQRFAEEDKKKDDRIVILGVVATLVIGAAVTLFLTKQREK